MKIIFHKILSTIEPCVLRRWGFLCLAGLFFSLARLGFILLA